MKPYKEFAVSLASEMGANIKQGYGKMHNLEWKLRINFKTEIDDDNDALARERIRKEYPDHSIMSEEKDAHQGLSEYTWVVDPLDGTLPFSYGISDHCGVSIALAHKGIPVLGVINLPLRGEMYVAEQGKGAYLNGKKIKGAVVEDINHAMVGLDYGKIDRTAILRLQEKLLGPKGVTYTVAYGCATAPMAFVASGKMHAYLSLNLEPWDAAAAVVLNQEAGNTVTAADGRKWTLEEPSILVAPPSVYKGIRNLLR